MLEVMLITIKITHKQKNIKKNMRTTIEAASEVIKWHEDKKNDIYA